MNYQFTLDNFNCYITKSDEILTLVAENQRSGQLFTRVITPDDLKTISRDPFFDISTTYQAIQDFFESKTEIASLSLTANGKLSYTCKRAFGNLTRTSEFKILLEKREMGASSLTKIKKVKSKKQEQEEFEFEFDPHSLFGLYFLFSNKNKTVSGICSSVAKHISTKQPLPKSKTCKVSFQIERNEQNSLGLGIASAEALSKEQPFLDSKAYVYFNGNYIWKNGRALEHDGLCPKKGDIVTFLIDTETGELVVDINGRVVDTHRFDAEDMKSTDFYPFVYTTGSIQVTLL